MEKFFKIVKVRHGILKLKQQMMKLCNYVSTLIIIITVEEENFYRAHMPYLEYHYDQKMMSMIGRCKKFIK